ncbi:MAG TPA: SwmB domain-containing protein, partial [Pseudonocardiaceae bacterium]|nr:SwmB domain-containing protein [Pseudonocardiaceae bacterium]
LDITIPAADPAEVWNLAVTDQEYDAVTGGRQGDPVTLTSDALPPLTFNTAEGGYNTEGEVANTAGRTHGFSYTATRTSPTPLTCTNQGFWTTPAGSEGPTADNPAGRPDTAPALTGATEADTGSNDVKLEFDQEMLATAAGTPAVGQFVVTVDGVSRNVTGIAVIDDSPPAKAITAVTFDGAALTAGQTVTVQYRQPVTSAEPALQDLESLRTNGFGPVSVPVF